MIPWHDIIIADHPAKDYRVKRARLYMQFRHLRPESRIFVPNHGVPFPSAQVEQRVWRSQWQELHSQYRTSEHTSIYFLLLHNRARTAKDYSVEPDMDIMRLFCLDFDDDDEVEDGANTDSDEEGLGQGPQELYGLDEDSDEDPSYDPSSAPPDDDDSDRECEARDGFPFMNGASQRTAREAAQHKAASYKVISCCLCGKARDSNRHGFVECEDVQAFWKAIIPFLCRTWGPQFVDSLTPSQRTSLRGGLRRMKPTLEDILFCFPTLKLQLKPDSPEWRRLILWHSCGVAVLYKIREKAFTRARLSQSAPSYHLREAEKSFEYEYRQALVDLYRDSRHLDRTSPLPKKKNGTRRLRVTLFQNLFLHDNESVTTSRGEERGAIRMSFNDILLTGGRTQPNPPRS